MHTKQSNGAEPGSGTNGKKLWWSQESENSGNVKQLDSQIAAVSKALAELESFGDRELVQPLEARLTDLNSRLHGARPIGQQVDGLRGVISRCQKRLAEAEAAKVEADSTITREMADIASYQAQLAKLEPLLATSVGFAKQMDRTMEYQSGSQTLCPRSQSTCGRATASTQKQWHNPCLCCWFRPHLQLHQTHCEVELWTVHPHDRRHLAWKQTRGWRRLAVEHEQREVHHTEQLEDPKDRRRERPSDAWSPPSKSPQPLRGGRATRAHIHEAKASSESGRVDYHRPRFFRQMATLASTLEHHLGDITTACSFGSKKKNDTRKP